MTMASKITLDRINTTSAQAHYRRIRNATLKVGRFVLHLLEMVLAMMAGMLILYLLDILSPESSPFAPFFEYGTVQFDFAMAVSMTVPMAAWMSVRRHDSRHVAEMAFGMNVLVAVIIVLRLLGADADMPWLADASHPAMFLGMIVAMVYRRDHYIGKAGHSAHTAHPMSIG